MVRDQQLKSTDFLALVREKLPLEPSIELIDNVLNQALATITRFVPGEWREDEAHRLFETAWQELPKAASSDAKIVWARTVFGAAITPDDVRQAARLMDGEVTIQGLEIDQAMRWSMVTKFCGMDLPDARERLEAEARRDPSDRGQRSKIQCETSFPDAGVKAQAWERFHGEGYGSLYLTTSAMGGFNWWRQRELLTPYVDRFFENVTAIFERPDKEFATAYFDSLFPAYRSERGVLDRASTLLGQVGARLPMLERKLREAGDDLERAIKCQEYARS
jgi:aminopeptidase N